MPYLTCPTCKSTYHVAVRGSPDEWNERFPQDSDGIRYADCYGCWKSLQDFDVVEVWNVPEEYADTIDKGDRGAVVHKFDDESFEIECVNDDGTTRWLCTLKRDNLWYVRQSS